MKLTEQFEKINVKRRKYMSKHYYKPIEKLVLKRLKQAGYNPCLPDHVKRLHKGSGSFTMVEICTNHLAFEFWHNGEYYTGCWDTEGGTLHILTMQEYEDGKEGVFHYESEVGK